MKAQQKQIPRIKISKTLQRATSLILLLTLLVIAPAWGSTIQADDPPVLGTMLRGGPFGTADGPFATMYDSDAMFLKDAQPILQRAAREAKLKPGTGVSDNSTRKAEKGTQGPELLSAFRSNKSPGAIAAELSIDAQTVEKLERLYERARTDRFIVKGTKPNVSLSLYGATSIETIEGAEGPLLVLTLPGKVNPREYANELALKGLSPQIDYIQPDLVLEFASFSLDMEEIQGPGVGTLEPGPDGLPDSLKEVIVALIDTGVDISHPLLSGRIIDGWNFIDDNDNVFDANNPAAETHGTHIAGIIASNSPYSVKIMPLKVFGPQGALTSSILKALAFAEANGAKVIGMSFGSKGYNPALFEAIESSPMLVIASVGNGRNDLSAEPVYPASFVLENIISVASLNEDKGFSFYSGYSNSIVDIAARGRGVESSAPGGGYSLQSGTSMAAGYVTAASASVLSYEDLDARELKERIVQSGDMYTHLSNKVAGGRSLNAANALAGVVVSQMETIDYAEDYDIHGYSRTDEENWQLFSSTTTVAVSAGAYTSMILKSDGSVWSFGENYAYYAGNGIPPYYTVPTEVIGLSNIVGVSAGELHCLAVCGDGTIWAYGENAYGQIGDGTYTDRATPVQCMGISGAISIAAGERHSMAATGAGELFAWGDNSRFQIASSSIFDTPVPEQIVEITDVVFTAAQGTKSLAGDGDGRIFTWGGFKNAYIVNEVTELENLDAGIGAVIKQNGEVWYWETEGDDPYYYYEAQVTGLTDMTKALRNIDYDYSCLALKNDGSVWSYIQGAPPVCINGLGNIADIALGAAHCIALSTVGELWTMGDNSCGQLGDGTTTNSLTPLMIIETMPLPSSIEVSVSPGALYVPQSGTASATASAIVRSFAGAVLNGEAVQWSIDAPAPTGVSIDPGTGVITVGTTAQGGTVVVRATSVTIPSVSGTYTLKLTGAANNGYELTITQGNEYRIVLKANDIASFCGVTITVTYDPAKLQLMDIAEQAYGIQTNAGVIPGTGITVTQVSSGSVSLTSGAIVPQGKTWSGVITILRFKALASGTTSISAA